MSLAATIRAVTVSRSWSAKRGRSSNAGSSSHSWTRKSKVGNSLAWRGEPVIAILRGGGGVRRSRGTCCSDTREPAADQRPAQAAAVHVLEDAARVSAGREGPRQSSARVVEDLTSGRDPETAHGV